MGIEPTPSAWKAEVLPLNYTRAQNPKSIWWRGKDSNLRRQSRQIYSLIPLTAREPLQGLKCELFGIHLPVSTFNENHFSNRHGESLSRHLYLPAK